MAMRTMGVLVAAASAALGCMVDGVAQEPWGDHRPVVSPDGRHISFMSNRSGTWAVYVMPLDRSSPARRVSDDPRGEWYADWSPDGKRLVYHRSDDDRGVAFLRVYDVREHRERALGAEDGMRRYARWTPDGTGVYYRCGETDTCLMAADGTERGIAFGLTEGQSSAMAPDGRWIAFIETSEDGEAAVYRARLDGSERTLLTTGQGNTYGLDWSPDGRYLGFNTELDGNADIYLYDTETGERRRVTTDPAEDHQPRWLPDGRSFVFTSTRSGAERIYRVDADGSGLRRIETR